MLEEDLLNIMNKISLPVVQANELIKLLNSNISKYKKVYVLAKLKKIEKESNGIFRVLDTDIKEAVFQIQITKGY